MRVRAIDANGDWTFGKGQNNYKLNNAAVAQSIETRLRCFLGDCFFEADAGIDWWNLLGSKDQLSLNLAISATILKTKDVTGIVQLTTNLDSLRKLTLSYEVSTIFSDNADLANLVATDTFLIDETGNLNLG